MGRLAGAFSSAAVVRVRLHGSSPKCEKIDRQISYDGTSPTGRDNRTAHRDTRRPRTGCHP
eukprot:6017145-Prymnesium_polylepis.1